MRIKLFLSLLVAGAVAAGAQTQGYKDGIEYYKAGQYDNAREILERTINNADTDKSLANYYLGQVALQNGDKAAAKAYFDKGIAIDSDNPYNYVGLGAIELMNNNASAADNNFKQAQKLAKKNPEVTINIARAYYNANPVAYAQQVQKNIDKARKDSKNQAPAIYILEGDMLADQKDFGSAASKYENAIINDANNPEGYVKYADAYSYVNPQFATQKLEEYLANNHEARL
ncbi:MAG: tetratricopeptide repeat protein [Muribaculaceae bacterium]|nr:tetratricopeptide repeat protein [Muribaculaceae bacterium]